jgi:hypothetical protein
MLEGATSLVQQISGFARSADGGVQDVDITRCFADLERLLRRIVRDRVSFEIDVVGPLPPVRCHRRNLEDADLNLVLNAQDAMPAGGVISIAATAAPTEGPAPDIMITVSDNGAGMPRASLAKAFDPFLQHQGHPQGNGLVLAMVCRPAQLARGSVFLQSTVGRGTEVTLQLPSFPRQHAGPKRGRDIPTLSVRIAILRPFPRRPFASKTPPARAGSSRAAMRMEILYVGVGDQFDDGRRLVRDRRASSHSTDPALQTRRRGRTRAR